MVISAVVPFFGGTSSATHSEEDTRLEYLKQTLDSLDSLQIHWVVYQSCKDKVRLDYSTLLDVDPIWLPWASCVAVQKQIAGFNTDLIYVTEADQILHVHDEDVFKIPNDERYLAPWRLDKVGPSGETELVGAPKCEIEGVSYGISNGAHHLKEDGDWGAVEIYGNQQAFSGAFFATRDYFNRIKFRKMTQLPVEHATGFDANSIGTCVKTDWVARCWVDHLSPRERWK